MTKVLAVLATLVLALLGAQVARADADFTDPTGDANGAPDVTNVSVFNDSANRVIFFAKIAGGKAMEADGEIGFVVDSDKNAETGDGGWDYWLVVTGDKKWNLLRWDGTAWVESPSTTAKVFVFDDVVYFGIDRAELGNTASFDFFVDASKYAGEQVVASDGAPDGDACWSYATVTKTYGLVRVADRCRHEGRRARRQALRRRLPASAAPTRPSRPSGRSRPARRRSARSGSRPGSRRTPRSPRAA